MTAGTSRTAPGGRAARLDATLAALLAQAPELEAAAVVSFDGLPMASALPDGMDEDRVAAMSAALLSLGERAAAGLGRGDLSQVYVEGQNGTVYLVSARELAVLVAVAAKGAKSGLMLFEVRAAAEQVADVLDAPAAPAAGSTTETTATAVIDDGASTAADAAVPEPTIEVAPAYEAPPPVDVTPDPEPMVDSAPEPAPVPTAEPSAVVTPAPALRAAADAPTDTATPDEAASLATAEESASDDEPAAAEIAAPVDDVGPADEARPDDGAGPGEAAGAVDDAASSDGWSHEYEGIFREVQAAAGLDLGHDEPSRTPEAPKADESSPAPALRPALRPRAPEAAAAAPSSAPAPATSARILPTPRGVVPRPNSDGGDLDAEQAFAPIDDADLNREPARRTFPAASPWR